MKSWMDLLRERGRTMGLGGPSDEMEEGDEPAAAESPDAAHGFTIGLKRKRRTSMLKNMLVDAGYGDLAKMINIKET